MSNKYGNYRIFKMNAKFSFTILTLDEESEFRACRTHYVRN